MSNTNARAAFPSIFSVASTGGSTTLANWKTCYGVTRITPPKYTRGTVDITDMNSTDYYEDNALAGPIRTGVIGFEANFLSTSTIYTSIKDWFESGQKMGWMITLAGSSLNTYYGDGVVTGYSMGDLTQEGKISMTFEMKTKGKPIGPVWSTTMVTSSAT